VGRSRSFSIGSERGNASMSHLNALEFGLIIGLLIEIMRLSRRLDRLSEKLREQNSVGR
jgi:hypothetical protein